MRRSSVIASAFVLLLSIVQTACTPPVQGLTKLNICSTATTTGLAVEHALRSDLFAKYGLEAELVPISKGSIAAAALIAGDVDICEMGGVYVVNAALAGEHLVIVAGLINQQAFSLVARPEIETAEDLKGKVVAMSNPGGASDAALRAMLEWLGLQPDVDVTLISAGRSLERLAAMETGQIAATVVIVTHVPSARELDFRVLVNASDLDIPYQHTVVATRRDFLEDNRQTVARFLQAIAEATAQMKQDQSKAMPILAENMLMDPDEDAELLNGTYDTLVLGLLSDKFYPTTVGVQDLIDAGQADNPNAVALSLDDIIDTSIVQELHDSGFMDKLYSQ